MTFSRFVALFGLVAVVLGAGLVLRPQPAEAHPIGNFTISRYARLELGADAVVLRYVIDMAEIPAFQELRLIDRDGDGSMSGAESSAYLTMKVPELLSRLDFRAGAQEVSFAATTSTLNLLDGQGGLNTLRIVVDATGVLPDGWQSGIDARFNDGNYTDRLGWKEIVVVGRDGIALTASSVATQDLTAELTAYPEERLTSPLDVREASFRFEAGAGAATTVMTPAPIVVEAVEPKADGFAALISREQLTPAFVALALLAAMFWGAAHALGPGHGKTIVAAYLVGTRSTAQHALLLGLTVTATHTSTVFALGVMLYASRFVPAEDLYVWLSVASGLLVIAMGAALLASRARAAFARQAVTATHRHDHGDSHDHSHSHSHGHDHGHGHSHLPTRPGLRGLIALGISGGLLPCPTALVVMLGAIALDRVAFGLALVLAFSVGLAGVLTGIGLLLVYARRFLNRSEGLGRITAMPLARTAMRVVPLGSAVLILAAGVVLTGRALSGA